MSGASPLSPTAEAATADEVRRRFAHLVACFNAEDSHAWPRSLSTRYIDQRGTTAWRIAPNRLRPAASTASMATVSPGAR